MIKSLSPYYVSIPFVAPLSGLTCTSYTVALYVWSGDKATPPVEPVYLSTKQNPTGSTSNDSVNIANLISSFIPFTQQEGTSTGLIDGNNQYWVKWQTYYSTSNINDSITPSNVNTKLFVKGYSYGMDGQNAETPVNKIL